MWSERAGGAIGTLLWVLPPWSNINQRPLKMRVRRTETSIPKGPVTCIQPELMNEKQGRKLSVYFGVDIHLHLLPPCACGFVNEEATATQVLYLLSWLSAWGTVRLKILLNTSFWTTTFGQKWRVQKFLSPLWGVLCCSIVSLADGA